MVGEYRQSLSLELMSFYSCLMNKEYATLLHGLACYYLSKCTIEKLGRVIMLITHILYDEK